MELFDIIKEQDDLKANEHRFFLWPRQWAKCVDIHKWQIYKLDESEIDRIPIQSGVYSLLIQPGIADHPACSYLMYIGQATSLRKRFMDYLNERKRETGRPKIYRLFNKYQSFVFFCCAAVEKSDLTKVENNLLNAYIPPANDQYPAEIRKIVKAFK